MVHTWLNQIYVLVLPFYADTGYSQLDVLSHSLLASPAAQSVWILLQLQGFHQAWDRLCHCCSSDWAWRLRCLCSKTAVIFFPIGSLRKRVSRPTSCCTYTHISSAGGAQEESLRTSLVFLPITIYCILTGFVSWDGSCTVVPTTFFYLRGDGIVEEIPRASLTRRFIESQNHRITEW